MVNLALQKRLAAQVLKVGKGRVWIDPEATKDIAEVITREDIRGLIEEGMIKKMQEKGVSRGRAGVRAVQKSLGRRRGEGSRKGAKGARRGKKQLWIIKIRALRRRLKELRSEGYIDKSTYRRMYAKTKGGLIRTVAQLDDYLTAYELLTREEKR